MQMIDGVEIGCVSVKTKRKPMDTRVSGDDKQLKTKTKVKDQVQTRVRCVRRAEGLLPLKSSSVFCSPPPLRLVAYSKYHNSIKLIKCASFLYRATLLLLRLTIPINSTHS